MKIAWIPEHPHGSLYRAKTPSRIGKFGELECLVTTDANSALQFDTKEECEAWISANPSPVFVARDHGFYGLDFLGTQIDLSAS